MQFSTNRFQRSAIRVLPAAFSVLHFTFSFFFVLVLGFINTAAASDSLKIISKKNTVFAEVGGKGPYYSINYDRICRQGNKLVYSFRVGGSLLSGDVAIPIAVNAFTAPRGKHHLEYSLGITPYIKDYRYLFDKGNLSDKKFYLTGGIGYRYQQPAGGFFFTAGFTPLLFGDPPSNSFWHFTPEFIPSANLAAGISF